MSDRDVRIDPAHLWCSFENQGGLQASIISRSCLGLASAHVLGAESPKQKEKMVEGGLVVNSSADSAV